MSTVYCGENCNHTGPHRYPPRAADEDQRVYTAYRNLAIAARMVIRAADKKERKTRLWYLARCVDDLDRAAGVTK